MALELPETWENLDAFVKWYIENGYPRNPPTPNETYFTDVGTSVIIFRHDHYQAEFYIGSPHFNTSKHFHPFEQTIMTVGGNGEGRRGTNINDDTKWTQITDKAHNRVGRFLPPHQWHQLSSFDRGLYFFNFQRWPDKSKMSSAIIGYYGESLGPVHDDLMDSFERSKL